MKALLLKTTNALIAFGPLGILIVSAIDSAGVPLPEGTDLWVIGLAVKSPDRAYLGALMATIGSVIGNMILFLLARRGGRSFMEKAEVPGKRQRFRAWFARYGLVTVFIPALVPVPLPLKIFVISAGALRMRVLTFFLVILCARIPRFFGEAYLGVKLGEESTAFLLHNKWRLLAVAAGLVVFLWGLIRVSDRLRRSPV